MIQASPFIKTVHRVREPPLFLKKEGHELSGPKDLPECGGLISPWGGVCVLSRNPERKKAAFCLSGPEVNSERSKRQQPALTGVEGGCKGVE